MWENRSVDKSKDDDYFELLLASAENNYKLAKYQLAQEMEKRGGLLEAIKWYKLLAVDGDYESQIKLTHLLIEVGDLDGAYYWFKTVPNNSKYKLSKFKLAQEIEEEYYFEESIEWFTLLAEDGDHESMIKLIYLLLEAGDIDGAYSWFKTLPTDSNYKSRKIKLVQVIEKEYYIDEATKWYRLLAEDGDHESMIKLIYLLIESKDIGGAYSWFKTLSFNSEYSLNKSELVQEIEKHYDIEGIIKWYRLFDQL